MKTEYEAPLTISVDTGGTFTDLVLADRNKVLGLYKASTTPHDLFQGIAAAVELAARDLGLDTKSLLAETGVFVYSTTQSTNAVIEGKTAKTALLTTKGFRDVLLFREGGKDDAFNLATPNPEPYIPRRLCFEAVERVLSDGAVVVNLDEDSVRKALQRMRELKIEAIAVCLVFSVVNPNHELRIGELIEEELPGVAYSLSHQVNNVVREYRRASSTAIDASLKPIMRAHLVDLERRFRELGFNGEPLMVTHVNGGMMSLEQMAERPIQTIDSGPALAPVAAAQFGGLKSAENDRDLIVVDTGGTSYDVSLVREGEIVHSREKWLGDQYFGHMTGLPAVDTRSLGAGGGSIAYMDEGGLVRVGPISAGATPGPACYGRGGTRPTVTDAALVIGYLDADNFLGGRMELDVSAARSAIKKHIADPLGIDLESAAEAILRITTEDMRGFTTDMTISQGIDPRNCVLVAGGGAAGMNIVRIARNLGIKEIIVPRLASGLSATGGQCSDISLVVSAGHFLRSKDFDSARANMIVNELSEQIDAFFDEVQDPGDRKKKYSVEARYDKQIWEIDVDLEGTPDFDDPETLQKLHDEFDRQHMSLFSVNQPGTPIEIVSWRAEGRVVRKKPSLAMPLTTGKSGTGNSQTTRKMYFNGTLHKGSIYRIEDLAEGSTMQGPAVIEEPTTTIVLDPGAFATVYPTHYHISMTHPTSGEQA